MQVGMRFFLIWRWPLQTCTRQAPQVIMALVQDGSLRTGSDKLRGPFWPSQQLPRPRSFESSQTETRAAVGFSWATARPAIELRGQLPKNRRGLDCGQSNSCGREPKSLWISGRLFLTLDLLMGALYCAF